MLKVVKDRDPHRLVQDQFIMSIIIIIMYYCLIESTLLVFSTLLSKARLPRHPPRRLRAASHGLGRVGRRTGGRERRRER